MRKPAPKGPSRPARSAPAREPKALPARPAAPARPAPRAKAGEPRAAASAPPTRRTSATAPAKPSRRSGPPAPAATARPKAPAKPARRPGTAPKGSPRNLERLQKILAHAGVDSRRKCEELILAGRVHVNGQLVTELGAKADPLRDEVTLDFQPVQREQAVYILMNKPKGYVTTVKDDEGRPTVMALLQGIDARVYPVGRLDFNSEGLLLMTNDGELAQHLSAPEFHIPKIYLVKVHRIPVRETLDDLREGFRLDGRRLNPCHIEMVEKTDNPWLRVTLIEGKNRQIRRMFEAVGHPVHKLRRIQYGPLSDPALKPGAWRFLTAQELAALKAL